MGKLVMGYWDCPVCGTKEIRGDVSACPSCGRARGDVQFYLKGYKEGELLTGEENIALNAEEIDEEKAAEISKNPDWYCPFCNSLNSDKSEVCTTCGASRTNSESNYFDELKKRREKETAEAAAQQPAIPKKRRSWIKIILPVVLVLTALFLWLNHNQTPGNYRISAVSWSREIQIVVPAEKTGEGWRQDLPDGATVVSAVPKLHHMETMVVGYDTQQVERTRRVVDHYDTYYSYEDTGNGYMEQVEHRVPVYRDEPYTETVRVPITKTEPQYADWCTYTVIVNVPARPPAHSEGNDQNPVWPEPGLTGDEQEGERTEIYRFTVTDEKGNQTVYRLEESAWNQIHVDDVIQIVTKRIHARPYIEKDGRKIADIEKD